MPYSELPVPTDPANGEYCRGFVFNQADNTWDEDLVRTRVFEESDEVTLPHKARLGDTLVFTCPSKSEHVFISPPLGEELEVSYADIALNNARFQLFKGESVRMVRTGTADAQKWSVCLGSGVSSYLDKKLEESAGDSYYSFTSSNRRRTGSINFYRHGGTIYVEFRNVSWGRNRVSLAEERIEAPPMLPKILDLNNPQNSPASFNILDTSGRLVPVTIQHDGDIEIYYDRIPVGGQFLDSGSYDTVVLNGSAVYLGEGTPESTLPKKLSEDVATNRTQIANTLTQIATNQIQIATNQSAIPSHFLPENNDEQMEITLSYPYTGTVYLQKRGGWVFFALEGVRKTGTSGGPLFTLPSAEYYPLHRYISVYYHAFTGQSGAERITIELDGQINLAGVVRNAYIYGTVSYPTK